MQDRHKRYFYLALLVGVLLHGATLAFTFEGTYDAFVHLFFANHYAANWFESWNYQWYTGFTVTSYPPLVHQVIAILSKVVGLKAGFLLWSFFIILVFIRGVYQFSRIWVGDKVAAYAAVLAVFSTSFGEALHIFGQLPSITGVAFLLNACPELYYWLRYGQRYRLFTGLAFLAITSTAHHVTTIFGMVFFVMPTLGLAVMNRCAEKTGGEENIHFRDIWKEVIRVLPRVIVFGLTVIAITGIVILPYWWWSKSDPITQVPIPHGSRDSFIEVLSSGLVFFLIPWGMMLFFLPYLFRELFRKRNIFLGLSISLAFLFGTGGTTPIPRMALGETAFNILTLDRFTYWASLLALPFWGQFFYELLQGSFGAYLKRISRWLYRFTVGILGLGVILSALMVINFQNFRSIQPRPVEMEPIVNFMSRDKHSDWRFLTLGFGDQMAWLSANTEALSVDGNYHSVRRLPEMTSRAVERLENAKYLGMEGINSLQEFLTIPEKYNLKFIFSNDKFYDPLLFFSGWRKVQQLENNIIVWERPDVPSLPAVLPRKNIPDWHRFMWGIIPISCLLIGLVVNLWFAGRKEERPRVDAAAATNTNRSRRRWFWTINLAWIIGFGLFAGGLTVYGWYRNFDHATPENLVEAYFHRIDFKNFHKAYSYFNPDTRPSLEQYMLELSVEGGILSSYAKLDSLDIEFRPTEHPNQLRATVRAQWLTALSRYPSEHQILLTRKGLRWYLEPFSLEKRTPPDQFVRLPGVDFYAQGKRKTLADKVEKRDILDRPDVYILSAKLLEKKDSFFIVGDLINIDNDPSYLTVEGILLDSSGVEIGRYNARDVVQHVIYPKQRTAFRIDFDDLLPDRWEKKYPDRARKKPADFLVYVRSMVAADVPYQHLGLQDIGLDTTGLIRGKVINFGARQVIIPQLLLSYYQNDRQLQWVESLYLSGGIRPQRSKLIEHRLPDLSGFAVLATGNDDNLRINGVSRREYREAIQFPLGEGIYPAAPFRLGDNLWTDIGLTTQMAALSDE